MNKFESREIPVFPEQIENVTKAIEKNQLVIGPHTEELSDSLSDLFNYKYAVLTSNGFSSLFSLLKVLNEEFSELVTIPTSTCFAFINASKAADFSISFIDSRPDKLDLDMNNIDNELEGPKIYLCPNHFGSVTSVNQNILPSKGFILEDAAQSFLSRKNISSDSDALVVSFYPTKISNGINGGAILTNNLDLYKLISKLINYNDQYHAEDMVRYNLGMNNLNAAFALGTLQNLEYLESSLMKNYQTLKEICESLSFDIYSFTEGEVPMKFIVTAEVERVKKILITAQKKGMRISSELTWLCTKAQSHEYINSEKFINKTLSLPFYPFMKEKDFEQIRVFLQQV